MREALDRQLVLDINQPALKAARARQRSQLLGRAHRRRRAAEQLPAHGRSRIPLSDKGAQHLSQTSQVSWHSADAVLLNSRVPVAAPAAPR